MYKLEDLQRVLKINNLESISLEQYSFSHIHSYANICQICFSHERDKRLKRCTRCKMVYYCGKEHQKLHWSSHKDFCNVATGLLAKFGGLNLFDRIRMGKQQARIDWKIHLIEIIEAGLRRKLFPYEQSLIFFPKLCAVCYETDPSLLEFCPKCPQANFCKDHFGDESHIEYCNLFTQGIILNAMGVTFKAAPIPGIVESVPFNVNEVSLPSNMQYFLDHYCKVRKSFLKIFNRTEIKLYMSEHFTRPLTLLYAMEKLRYSCQESMTIHVIAANNFEEVGQQTWEVLLHWLPKLISLRVILIGPECASVSKQISVCKLCNINVKKLYFECHGLLYKDYYESRDFTIPNIVIGFNAGLKIYDTWTDSLLMLTKVNCPFILTTFWEEEIDLDHEIMLKIFGQSARYTCREKNPFASLRPYRDGINIKVFYRNFGILMYTKLGQKKIKSNSSDLLMNNEITNSKYPGNNKFELGYNPLTNNSISAEIW